MNSLTRFLSASILAMLAGGRADAIEAPCSVSVSSSVPGVAGTTAVMVFDGNPATGLRTDDRNWQFIELTFGCEVDILGIRRHFARRDGTTTGRRTNQGEFVSYSSNGSTWITLPNTAAGGWERAVVYSGNAWHSVAYGWSPWLRPTSSLHVRKLRFHWDGDMDVLRELELDSLLPPSKTVYLDLCRAFPATCPAPAPEALFPERRRGVWLSDGVPRSIGCLSDAQCTSGAHCYSGACVPDESWYSFETCELADLPTTIEKVRVRYADLDGMAGFFPTHVTGLPACPQGGCFLRVDTAHIGRTVTITPSGISCDDPASTSLGTCALDMTSTGPSGSTGDAAAGYRGNVVMADRIIVSGGIDIGSLSLVLIAGSIDFLPGSSIRGATGLPPVPAPPSAVTPIWRTQLPSRPSIDAATVLALHIPQSFPDAAQGIEGAASGTVMLLAPSITGQAAIDLRGQMGGPGQTGASVNCTYADQGFRPTGLIGAIFSDTCTSLTDALPPPVSGRGGRGGAGGRLIVRTARAFPSAIVPATIGAPPAPGGALGQYTVRCGSGAGCVNGAMTTPYGRVGPTGVAGTNGSVELSSLAGDYADLAFLFARRGATRLLVNGRHFARLPIIASPSPTASQASDFLNTLLTGYCPARVTDVLAGAPLAAPTPLIAVTTRAARQRVCNETRVLATRMNQRQNFLGLPLDYFMYVTPDAVDKVRKALVEAFTSPSGPRQHFWDVVGNVNATWSAQQQLTDQRSRDQAVRVAADGAAQLKQARRDQVAKTVFITLQRVKRNHALLADLQHRIESVAQSANDKLKPQECDFLCWFGRVISFASHIFGLITNVVDAVNGIAHFVQGFGDVFDSLGSIFTTNIADNLEAYLRGDVTRRDLFFESVLTYANQLVHGVGTTPGIASVGSTLGALPAAWEAVKNDARALNGLLASNAVADKVKAAGGNNAAILEDLLNQQRELRSLIASVEGGGGFVDRAGALGELRTMLDLEDRMIDLSRESETLLEEHVLATGELTLAETDARLADAVAADAAETLRRTECRLGARMDCQGIPVASDRLAARLAAREAACRSAQPLNDQILTFDYYYQRAVDYSTLTPQADASHDFSRNLLIRRDLDAFTAGLTSDAVAVFINNWRNAPWGMERETYCDDDPTRCSADSAAVLTQLKRRGVAYFDRGPTASSDRQRLRVVSADVDLKLNDTYSLGCPTATGCRLASAPDSPLQQQSFRMDLGHGAIAHFRMGSSAADWRSFVFEPTWPRLACDVVNGFLGVPVSCDGLVKFTDTISYVSPSGHIRATLPSYDPSNFQVSPLFGTSVAGRWKLDLRPILRNLNGGLQPNDDCYSYAATVTGRLPANCVPSDGAGRVEWTVDRTGRTPAENLCARYITGGALESYGTQGNCCTQAGGLNPTRNATACAVLGYASEDACRTPDVCWEICGPRCRGFKDALRGFEFLAYWREGVQQP